MHYSKSSSRCGNTGDHGRASRAFGGDLGRSVPGDMCVGMYHTPLARQRRHEQLWHSLTQSGCSRRHHESHAGPPVATHTLVMVAGQRLVVAAIGRLAASRCRRSANLSSSSISRPPRRPKASRARSTLGGGPGSRGRAPRTAAACRAERDGGGDSSAWRAASRHSDSSSRCSRANDAAAAAPGRRRRRRAPPTSRRTSSSCAVVSDTSRRDATSASTSRRLRVVASVSAAARRRRRCATCRRARALAEADVVARNHARGVAELAAEQLLQQGGRWTRRRGTAARRRACGRSAPPSVSASTACSASWGCSWTAAGRAGAPPRSDWWRPSRAAS